MNATAERASDVDLVRRARRACATDRHPEGSTDALARRLRIASRTVRRWLTGESTIRDASLRSRVQRIAREAPE